MIDLIVLAIALPLLIVSLIVVFFTGESLYNYCFNK